LEKTLFITFEGIEGCGKSTQAKRIANRLEREGVSLILTREPGGTPVGSDIRQILLSSKNRDLPPLAELLLYEADRALHMSGIVKPALAKQKWVLCDRFFDATTAYQGYVRGQDLHVISRLNEIASSGITPDITFLLDCPVSVGIKRALKRNAESEVTGQDRFEQEKTVFHEAVRNGYLDIAKNNPDRFVVVDAAHEENRLEEIIFSVLESHLPLGRC
jgi:dTMP kinase